MKVTLDGIIASDHFILQNDFTKAKDFYNKQRNETFRNEQHHFYTVYCNYYCDFLIKTGDYKLAQKELADLRKSLKKYSLTQEVLTVNKIYICQNYGELYNHIGEYHKAIKYLKFALRIQKYYPGCAIDYSFGDHYFELAKAYRKLGDYDQALSYFSRAYFQYTNDSCVLCQYKKAQTVNCIGVTFWYKNDVRNTEIFINRSHEIQKQIDLPQSHFALTKIENDLGLHFWKKAKQTHVSERAIYYVKAFEYFEKAKDRYIEFFGTENHRFIANIYGNYGQMYRDQGDPGLARAAYEEEIRIRSEIFKHHPSLIRGHSNMAELCLDEEDFKGAFNHANQAIFNGIKDNGDGYACYKSDYYEPIKKPTLRRVAAHYLLIRALYMRAKSLLCLYEKALREEENGKAKVYLELAYDTLYVATQLVEDIRNSYLAEGSILQASAEARPVYELFIDVIYTLIDWLEDGFDTILGLEVEALKIQAFDITEKGKATLLLRTVEDSQQETTRTKRKGGSVGEILGRQPKDEVKSILLQYLMDKQVVAPKSYGKEKKMSKAKPVEPVEHKTDKTKEEELSGFEKKSLKTYGDYFEQINRLSVKEAQEELSTDAAAIISYFVGESQLYAFVITKNKFEVKELKFEHGKINNMEHLREVILDFSANLSKGHADFNDAKYIQTARSLYDMLFKPLEAYLKEINRIYLIPEDTLSILPFEALVSKDVDFSSFHGGNLYPHLDYLLKRFEISYHFSLTLLARYTKEPLPNRDLKHFVGFAPDYEGLEMGEALPYARREIKEIGKLFKKNKLIKKLGNKKKDDVLSMYGKRMTVKRMTVKKILKTLPNYQFVHFTAHYSPEEADFFAGIMLPISADEIDYLTLKEVYELNLETHLVVLSCCSTGLGAIEKGEGPIAFNRSFVLAGARNIIYTLFDIHDDDAYRLLLSFYQKILKGKYYSKALHEAKLEIMRNSLTPSCWSGFVYMGNQLHHAFEAEKEIRLHMEEDGKLPTFQLVENKGQMTKVIDQIGPFDLEHFNEDEASIEKIKSWNEVAKLTKAVDDYFKSKGIDLD